MSKLVSIFLVIAVAIGFLLMFLVPPTQINLLIISGIIFVLGLLLVYVNRKVFARTSLLKPLTYARIPTVLECPKCGSKLNQALGNSGMPQIYACPNCGYSGAVGLNPKNK